MLSKKLSSTADVVDTPEHPSQLESPGGYRLEDQVGFVIRKASQRHGAIFTRLMSGDLTPTQWAALVKLAEVGSVSQNQLGRETAMDVATIKGVVDRLARRQLICISNDPNDGRRSIVSLSEDGKSVVKQALPCASAISAETLCGLTTGEQMMLVELLRKIS